jgi:hypothetical protein
MYQLDNQLLGNYQKLEQVQQHHRNMKLLYHN